MKFLAFFILFSFTLRATAKVEVLFHPYDNTLQKISSLFANAQHSIDMALYNIDVNETNPVIKTLGSPAIQHKINSGLLKVRIIFEGYSSKENNFKRMKKLEELGIDARYLGVGRKMHHKFATVDANGLQPYLITGSANWSMMSRRHYNENILYFQEKPGITLAFQEQFELLWSQSKEFGFATQAHDSNQAAAPSQPVKAEVGLDVNFNTDNFKITDRGFRKRKDQGYVLTDKVVKAIDRAQDRIDIATTRIKLRPIYEAIKRAAQRGVKINIVVTMGEYSPKYFRAKKQLKTCDSIYDSKCSTSQNFAIFLYNMNYPGKENVSIRIKYFDLRTGQYLSKQMHSKYMIVDNIEVHTGSFNWSYSAEYNHFENLVSIDGDEHTVVLSDFAKDFRRLWRLNRKNFPGQLLLLKNNSKVNCSFEAMTLTFEEIDSLLNTARKIDKKIKNICL